MNNYIVLDSYKYMTPANDWIPVPIKPGTARKLINGNLDVTYGPGTFKEWHGTIEGPVTPIDAAWGTEQTLRTTIIKRQGVSFQDHYGTSYTVHVLGELSEQSMSPVWDAPSNIKRFKVRLIAE